MIDVAHFTYIAELVRDQKVPTDSCLLLAKNRFGFDFPIAVGIAARAGLLERQDGKLVIPQMHPLSRVMADGQTGVLDASGRTTGEVSDTAAFAALGFRHVDSVGTSDDGTTIKHDLNDPGLAQSALRRYDLILDEGVMGATFHVPNLLENANSVLNVGGYILHSNPMNNHVDHGFYQFSPTFYYDFYVANGYDAVNGLVVDREAAGSSLTFFQRYERTATSLRLNPYLGSHECRPLEFWFVARKTKASTGDRVPQQFLYDGTSLAGHSALADVKSMVVWGAGLAASTVLASRLDIGKISYFIDTDSTKYGTRCLGLPIKPPEALLEERDSVVLISSVTYEDAIRLQISRRFATNVGRILTLGELMVDPHCEPVRS